MEKDIDKLSTRERIMKKIEIYRLRNMCNKCPFVKECFFLNRDMCGVVSE